MGPIRLAWLGHATVVIELDGVRVLTDPLLQKHAGLLRRRTPQPDPAQWRGVDAVLVSHLHHDHAQLRSLRQVAGRPLLSAAPNVEWMRRRHLADAVALDNERWTRIARNVEVRQVRADHQHRPMPRRPNAANGHVLRGPSGTVWVAGDTSLYPEMTAMAEIAGGGIDLALVPIGGWGPRLSPGHMDPDQAARAVAMSGAGWAVPVHWGTLHPPFLAHLGTGWLENPGQEFAQAVTRVAPACRVVVLSPGQEATVPLASSP